MVHCLRLILILTCFLPGFIFAGEAEEQIETRLREDLKFLADDAQEGRGVETEGLNRAADYIKKSFQEAGLDVTKVNGDAFQPFEIPLDPKLGENNRLKFTREGEEIPLVLGQTFQSIALGNSGAVSTGVVFVGYGITAPNISGYDDYAGVDAKGKVVLCMRREPRQAGPMGFTGKKGLSELATFKSKIENAIAHGAVAVIFVDEPYTSRAELQSLNEFLEKQKTVVVEAAEALVSGGENEEVLRKKLNEAVTRWKVLKGHASEGASDRLLGLVQGGGAHPIPVFHITRKACDELLKKGGLPSLNEVETKIDSELKPQSAELVSWRVEGESNVLFPKAAVKNVIGVLEGEGPLAEETIVIGAHYDHVGLGGNGSLAPGESKVHNGADDNASGTVALLEVARRFGLSGKKPARRLVFMAFTGEELGLLGSAHYCREPVFPLDSTVAMFNMDMVGRLTEGRLTIFGAATSPVWKPLIEKYGKQHELEVITQPEGFGPSDHSSFYAKKIPVLHYFTGLHPDYHRPGDDWEKVNIAGVRKISQMVGEMIQEVQIAEQRPEYVLVPGSANVGRSGSRPYFGSIPDFGVPEPGYSLSGVAPESPAAKAGMKAGDRIIKLGGQSITNLDDFDSALRKFKAGEEVEVTIVRDKAEMKLKVTLAPPR